ncbi:uncharacterized protein IAS62_000310 [Cryptococcus decagattii]|uniref:Uncharacterized protein n=1 Tax=Cryptococcus decagattii TaxID=1859122 RepID=A0ABZ2AM69_9TREE
MIIFGGYTETGPADGGVYIYSTVLNSWVTNFSPALGRSPGGMRVHPGPLSKTARSSEDAGHPDMCDTFVGSESEYISQSMCLSSNPTASEGSLAPRETSIIPKHRETSPGQDIVLRVHLRHIPRHRRALDGVYEFTHFSYFLPVISIPKAIFRACPMVV